MECDEQIKNLILSLMLLCCLLPMHIAQFPQKKYWIIVDSYKYLYCTVTQYLVLVYPCQNKSQMPEFLQILHKVRSCAKDHGVHRFTISAVGILPAIGTSVSNYLASLFIFHIVTVAPICSRMRLIFTCR